jgi:4-hydroxybenzoate polyprenyltransferase
MNPSLISTWLSIGRIHIVAIACMGCFTFGWLFLGEHPWMLSAFCALDWFLVNLLNRVVDLKEDQANQIAGADIVARNKRLVLWGGFSLLGASFLVSAILAPTITIYRLLYHLLGFSYNWPLFPGGRRLKQLYFWKNTASATGFLLTLFAYPLSTIHWDFSKLPQGLTGTSVGLTALFFFLFEISYEILYDLRDLPGDRLAEVKTYPVVHGEAVSLYIIDTLLAVSILILWAGFWMGHLPWKICIMFVAPVLQWVLYKRALARGPLTSADCIRLTWLGAMLLVCYHVWVWLGLPGV